MSAPIPRLLWLVAIYCGGGGGGGRRDGDEPRICWRKKRESIAVVRGGETSGAVEQWSGEAVERWSGGAVPVEQCQCQWSSGAVEQ